MDQDGEVVDVFLQKRRDGAAAKRFFKRLLKVHRSVQQAQRFPGVHAAVYDLFNLGRHLICAEHYRSLRMSAFASWKDVAA